jgi:hypothetical protein
MLELFVEGLHAHRTHPLVDQIPDRILHHRAGNAGAQPKAVRQIRRHIELAAAHMHCKVRGLAKWNNSRIEPMHQRTQRKQIQRLLLRYIKTKTHNRLLKFFFVIPVGKLLLFSPSFLSEAQNLPRWPLARHRPASFVIGPVGADRR